MSAARKDINQSTNQSIYQSIPIHHLSYVGEDVEAVIGRLVEKAGFDVGRAQAGVVFLDELDKIAKTSGE